MLRYYCLLAVLSLGGCSGLKYSGGPAAGPIKNSKDREAGPADPLAGLASEDRNLFAEAMEYMRLGGESLQDSLWFEAAEIYDSAMAQIFALETSDSLGQDVRNAARVFRDSLEDLMLLAIARAAISGETFPWSTQFDESMESVPDSATEMADSLTHGIKASEYDLPLDLPLHPRVLQAIAVFTGPGRGYFSKWLNRRSRYEELIHAKLEAAGLPKDLLYLAMIESGFNPKAWSKASASGLWQFISATGRRYGLENDWWLDMRRDPAHATDAAIGYLSELYAEFGDWYLAMAGYNCGENRIRRLLAQDSSLTYWDMPLPKETRFYVPKILAAMIIGHNPGKYGFTIDDPHPPLVYDTATVEHCMTLKTIAAAAEVDEKSIIELNPALRRWCSPPNRKSHMVNLPAGTRETFFANYHKLDKSQLVSWQRHRVTRGENLSLISSKYGVSIAALRSANKLRGSLIRAGQVLVIPISSQAGDAQVAARPKESPHRYSGGTYTVRRGDNLFDIARRLNISFSDLLAANGLNRGSVIRPGQKLRLSPGEEQSAAAGRTGGEDDVAMGSAAETSDAAESASAEHRVRSGETLHSISLKLGVTVQELKRWNGLRSSHIRAGQVLRYAGGSPPGGGAAAVVHRVRAGETVYQIARKHDTTQQTILELNGLSADSHIYPGDSLIIAMHETGGARSRSAGKQYYVVKSGDSLWDISVRFNSSLEELRKLNRRLPRVLKPGQRIRIR